MSVILGMSGAAGSGKDTVADYLISKHGWCGKISFARNLKDMCKAVFDLSEHDVSDHGGKKALLKKPVVLTQTHINLLLAWMCKTHDTAGFTKQKRAEISKMLYDVRGSVLNTPREILQFVGTDFCRTIISSYHIDIVLNKIKQLQGRWVITDVRFPNEAEMISALSGKIVRIERPGIYFNDSVARHESERALDGWACDATIVNDAGSVEDLYLKVDKLLEENTIWRTTNTL